MKKSVVCFTTFFILASGFAFCFGQQVSPEARKYFDRGVAAMEMAKTPQDCEAAIREFELAIKLAPNWPDAFYNLGLAQEKAEKLADAVRSYREYLRLAPNADDTEEVKSLINKLEYKAIPVLPIARGFMGIPWGATEEQITETLNGQGYQQVSHMSFGTDFAGAPFRLTFLTENNSFHTAVTHAIVRTVNRQAAYAVFKQKLNELSKEYGSPNDHHAETIPTNDGGSIPFEYYKWNLVDQRTSDKYTIKVEYTATWFTDIEGDAYIVDIWSSAESLRERLKNMGTGTRGEDVNARDALGGTPLDYACMSGNMERAERLIAQGADINAKDDTGETPLHKAVVHDNKEIAELLIAKGADINSKDMTGDTPLHMAAALGKKEIAELLIAKGADINAKDKDGNTTLQREASLGKKEMVEFLVAKGADINAKDKDGGTPLHHASYNGKKEMAELLIAKGAEINAKADKNGGTPLHWAAGNGRTEMAELLIAKGADVNAKDKIGETPLRIAESKGFKEIVDLLKKHGAKDEKEPVTTNAQALPV